jgi:hypothetical protein
MRVIENLLAGWIDTGIRRVIDAGLIARFKFILITSIDSSDDILQMAENTHAFGQNWRPLGKGIIVPGREIDVLAKNMSFFTGFDELWGFEKMPVVALPDDTTLVAPVDIRTDPVPLGLVPWMNKTDCKLGLGDGVGANYVASDRELAVQLEHSFGQ